MSKEAKQQEKKPEEEEETNENGIPNPPGFTNKVSDFSTISGKRLMNTISERVSKSITFTPVMGILMPVVSLFIMGGNLIMGSYQLINLLKVSLNAFMTGITPDRRINLQNRLILFASALGILLFCLWRASKMGLFGSVEQVQTVVEKVPYFLIRQ